MPTDTANSFGEFDLIERYFSRHKTPDLSEQNSAEGSINFLLGVGDDCALLSPPMLGDVLAVTTDMLVEGRHFLPGADPEKLAHKCLAVNLSDLAAMGAKPIAFTLSLALPKINEPWLEKFSNGLYALADTYHCKLIGGDTTSGPLTISITAFGEINPREALRRSGAVANDDIWISNVVGDARLALGHLRGEWPLKPEVLKRTQARMDTPTARVALGLALRQVANSAIDISDGLLGDLRHILKASKLNAQVLIDDVPVSKDLADSSLELKRLCSLKGGDDYELCFTAPEFNREIIEGISKSLDIKLTRIGKVTSATDTFGNIELFDGDKQLLDKELTSRYLGSFDHFKRN